MKVRLLKDIVDDRRVFRIKWDDDAEPEPEPKPKVTHRPNRNWVPGGPGWRIITTEFVAGAVIEASEATARKWIEKGLATPAD
jgi:hypothetical protein